MMNIVIFSIPEAEVLEEEGFVMDVNIVAFVEKMNTKVTEDLIH